MTTATIQGYDATGANETHLPAGQVAGYTTGTGVVPWSEAQWIAHPGAVRIDQSPAITSLDILADFYDLENGAVTVAEIAQVVKDGQAAFMASTRPGQRWPGVYCSRDNVTAVVNALIAGGVLSCPLGIADYSGTEAEAAAEVADSVGPFPVVWRQYADTGGGGTYDLGVFSAPWLANVSGAKPAIPPGQWNDASTWTWNQVGVVGVGLDSKFHLFMLTAAGSWAQIA